ncbi:DNZ54_00345 family protein [Kosakonia sacchari]|uniref:DNZ54_00345 family protein n=1 Tax=Kosakonia sacchari TaxID=1158459 RepID=UPI0009F6C275|nr:DNZ54_00345 family protein [Kosakonia sacchari]
MNTRLILPAVKAMTGLMLLLGLIYPDSVAVNFIVILALFICLICFAGGLTGAAVSEYWLRHRREGGIDRIYAVLIVSLIFFYQSPARRKFWSVLMLAFTFPCLVSGGHLLFALFYLSCLAGFMAVRASYCQRIREAGLCQNS